MCGIIGYRGDSNSSELVFSCLKKLEYRGYDSWGLAVKTNSKSKLLVQKEMGQISSAKLKKFPNSNLALAHTRWATHGKVTKQNAHPHLSNNKKIAVVHNGIVENFQELKSFLKEKGFSFYSETDTEIIPNLIQFFLSRKKSFKNSVMETCKKIEGSFAIVAINSDSNELIGAKNGSPLVAGFNTEEVFLASDVPAFLDFAKNVFYLEDNELVLISDKIEFFSIQSGKKISKKAVKVQWSLEQAKKGKFKHFMLKEIYEQMFSIKQASEQDNVVLKKVSKIILSSNKVFFTGCGTSYHACLSGSYWFSQIVGKHSNVVLSSEFKSVESFLDKNSVVIALSQSGETTDVIEAVKKAKEKKAKVVSLVNVMGSTLTRLSDQHLMLNSGPEICVLSTKTYTAQLSLLLYLSYFLVGKQKEAKKIIQKVSSKIEFLIKDSDKKAKKLAKKIFKQKSMFVIGRNNAFASSMESALKIKEVTYIHAEGLAGGELKHGTIALIEKNVPVIVLSENSSRKLILSNAMEIKSRGGFIIGIDSVSNQLFDFSFSYPELGYANPILMIIPSQLLAYYVALLKNLDPDKPRNLAKSVTVK